MNRPILVASDGTSGSDGALRFATAVAQVTSRPLEVLAVQEPVALQVFSELPSIPQGYSLQQSLDADDLRTAVAKRLAVFDTMTVESAEHLLDGKPLIAAMAGSIPEMKALRDRCLVAGIPAIVGCPPGAGKG